MSTSSTDKFGAYDIDHKLASRTASIADHARHIESQIADLEEQLDTLHETQSDASDDLMREELAAMGVLPRPAEVHPAWRGVMERPDPY